MTDIALHKKSKVNLDDYEHARDVQCRKLLQSLSKSELSVLEEILFSSTKIEKKRLASNCSESLEVINPILDKLKGAELFSIEDDTLFVDKERRRYFEAFIERFEEDFTPGMDFIQSILRVAPIHALPVWYPIPRTSNNIFESLVEKHLSTPKLYRRYLRELQFEEPHLELLIQDLVDSEKHELSESEIKERYSLSDDDFIKTVIMLEFHFVGVLKYEWKAGSWHSSFTMFREWKEYRSFLQNSCPKNIDGVTPFRTRPFAFVEDLSHLLTVAHANPIPVNLDSNENWNLDKAYYATVAEHLGGFDLKEKSQLDTFRTYTRDLVQKALFLKLLNIENRHLHALPSVDEWLTFSVEKRALASHKFTLAKHQFGEIPLEIATDRNIKEIEKSVTRLIGLEWVEIENFLSGMMSPISLESKMVLTKTGKKWKYPLPSYSDDEKKLMRHILIGLLFEAGIVDKGLCGTKECFRITPFGISLYGG